MKSIVTIGEILVEIMATETGDGFLEPVKLIGPYPSGAPAIFIALLTLYTNAIDTSTTIFGHASFSIFGWTFGWYGIGGVIAMVAGPVAYLYFKRTLGGRPLQPEPVREPTDAV